MEIQHEKPLFLMLWNDPNYEILTINKKHIILHILGAGYDIYFVNVMIELSIKSKSHMTATMS